MASAPRAQPDGRLANVSAALVLPTGCCEHEGTRIGRQGATSTLLRRLFEDVVIVADAGAAEPGPAGDVTLAPPTRWLERDAASQSPLADLALALEAAREERQLVLAADSGFVTAELLLGLTAWPEHECVAPRIDGAVQPFCALYQREAALRALHAELARDEPSLSSFLNQLDCGVLEGDDLECLLPAKLS